MIVSADWVDIDLWTGDKRMRGEEKRSESFFSYVALDRRIPADHPLRAIRKLIDERWEAVSGVQ